MHYPQIIILMTLSALTCMAGTRVHILGMRDKSEAQVLDMMGGRLEHIRASPASPPLADDAAFILRQLLRKEGYANASVDWKINGRDEVALIVNQGSRLSLGNVHVNGVPEEDAKKFAQLYAKPAETRRLFGGDAPPFREEDVASGLSYLRQELNARGYWQAEADLTKRTTDSATGAVDLIIEVRQGPLFHIGRPRVTSAVAEQAKAAAEAAQPFIGRKATTAHVNGMRLAVEQTFIESGYPNALIQMSRTLEGGKFIPAFSIVLGERVRLGHLEIEGLERTSATRISDRFHDMEGDWYDEAAVNLRLREFLGTGAFSSARVETMPAGDGVIDATLHFDETRAREITLGAGVGSYQGFITRAAYIDRNLFGQLIGLNAGMELSFLGLLGEVRVTNPWLFASDVSGTARAYALIYNREGYVAYESGLDAQLRWKFGKHYQLELLAGTSLVSLEEDGLPSAELGETNYNHSKLRLTHKLDFRDSPVLPKSGWHLESPLEIGAAIGDVTTSYVMTSLSGGWYHKLNRHYDIGIGGEIGLLIPSGDGRDLPIDLRLFNGGGRSVRSFPERELGPQVEGYPTGGEAMWNTNFELIRKITDTVSAVAFIDAGTLSREFDGIGSADLELATGLGIRLDLPIGPVRFEYGFNLTRDAGEPAGAFHFAIGTAY